MTDDVCEKMFKTTMLADMFQKLAQRTCRAPFWISIEGRDRSEKPHAVFFSVVFSTIEDRDRFTIAMRFAEQELAAAADRLPAKATPAAGRRAPAPVASRKLAAV
jgi:hypothetical protein